MRTARVIVGATRRRFLSIVGAAPIAAKTAIDAEIGKAAGLGGIDGLGNPSMGLSYGSPMSDGIPYGRKIISASQYVSMFGIPDVVEFELRDRARCITFLDPDIACKRAWSMSVKIMTQRQRNYERARLHIERSGWRHAGMERLKKALGFEWPW
jgi:hypothetical protein